jgi:hypothetical protein
VLKSEVDEKAAGGAHNGWLEVVLHVFVAPTMCGLYRAGWTSPRPVPVPSPSGSVGLRLLLAGKGETIGRAPALGLPAVRRLRCRGTTGPVKPASWSVCASQSAWTAVPLCSVTIVARVFTVSPADGYGVVVRLPSRCRVYESLVLHAVTTGADRRGGKRFERELDRGYGDL